MIAFFNHQFFKINDQTVVNFNQIGKNCFRKVVMFNFNNDPIYSSSVVQSG